MQLQAFLISSDSKKDKLKISQIEGNIITPFHFLINDLDSSLFRHP